MLNEFYIQEQPKVKKENKIITDMQKELIEKLIIKNTYFRFENKEGKFYQGKNYMFILSETKNAFYVNVINGEVVKIDKGFHDKPTKEEIETMKKYTIYQLDYASKII